MGGRKLSHDLRLELYRRVLELHGEGVSYRKIQRIIEGEYGIRISRSHISYWVRGLHIPEREPYNRVDSSKREELAWIAGMYVGDGSIKVSKEGRFLSLKVKDRELAEVAAKKLAAVVGRDRPYAIGRLADGRYYVEVQSRELVDILMSRENLLGLLRERPVEFIRAFFDCEGYATGLITGKGGFQARVGAVNTDLDLLERIQEELAGLGILCRIYMLYPKEKVVVTSKGRAVASRDCYNLMVIRSGSIIEFSRRVGFSIGRKMEKLRDIAEILDKYGTGRRAAIEWIRRYEHRTGEGRERWFRRERVLGLDEAVEEYSRFVSKGRRERTRPPTSSGL